MSSSLNYPYIFTHSTKEVLVPLTIKLQRKSESVPMNLPLHEFERLFHLKYRPFLNLVSKEQLAKVIRNCPYIMRYFWPASENHQWMEQYRSELVTGKIQPVYVKWINPILEYGLFADVDIKEGAFIGEYTGMLRFVLRRKKNYNPYCFHYPTRFFSWNYLVIDALNEGNLTRFINHDYTPNLKPLCVVDKGLLHIIFVANKSITKHTQLTFDYSGLLN